MKKIIRLTERDLTRIVKRVIQETMEKKYRVVEFPKDVYDKLPTVEIENINEYSQEVDGRKFEHKGSALRHAENLYNETQDDSTLYIVVDDNNTPYTTVPGFVKGKGTRWFTGFGKGYNDELMEEEEMSIPTATKGGTVKSLAQKHMPASQKKDWPELYKLSQNDNTNWVVSSVDGTPKVGGVSKNLEGKYFKSTDYIDVSGMGSKVYFANTKGFHYEGVIATDTNGKVYLAFAEE
jgi:hypothetical protein